MLRHTEMVESRLGLVLCSRSLSVRSAACAVRRFQMTEFALDKLLDELDDRVKTELNSKPEVVDRDDQLDVQSLPILARRWHRASDVVAVFADLKNSSQLGTNIHAASTASVYEAAVGGVVHIFDQFDANYIDIQGDAAFAVFWGEKRIERAMCAGITIKTFSEDMTEHLERKWPDQPETGFRVGVASSAILVKRIGTPRNPAHQKPVWAGRAVNYASKAGSAGERHQLVVTGSVWDRIENNDYLTVSCGCAEPNDSIWQNVTIDRLREGDDAEGAGRLLTSKWCVKCGPDFCRAVLDGETQREDVKAGLRAVVLATQRDNARYAVHARARDLRARRRGLALVRGRR